ncbi:MAG: hypothetical protein WD069_12380 [Planctomycetales bacterium]
MRHLFVSLLGLGFSAAIASAELPHIAPDAILVEVLDSQKAANDLVTEARRLESQGLLIEAEVAAKAAKNFEATYRILDDTPDAVLWDVERRRAEAERKAANALVAEARSLMSQGRLKEAEVAAKAAQNFTTVIYGTLDTTPEAVLREIERRRAEPERVAPQPPTIVATQKAARELIAKARSLLSQGRLAEARIAAVGAKMIGATYRNMDDSPDRVLADIATAEANEPLRLGEEDACCFMCPDDGEAHPANPDCVVLPFKTWADVGAHALGRPWIEPP